MATVERARVRVGTLLGGAPGACPPADDAYADGRAPDRRCGRWTLALVCVATALLLFNVTSPNVALPAIARSLGAGFDARQWILSSYALVLASLLLALGALGDRRGRRSTFLAGLVVFAVASLGCALAPSPALLIAGRAAQGVGAALLFPAGLALIAAEFSGAARARAIGVWGASVSAAIALGPLVGGLLVDGIGWRAIFALPIVLSAPLFVLGARQLRESRDPASRPVDWTGAALLTAGLVLVVFVLVRGNAAGWLSATTLGLGGAGLALLAGFVVAEHHTSHPLLAPELMRNRTFVAASLVALVFAAAGFGPVVYVTLFLIDVTGASPAGAGAELVPFAAASFGVSLLAARVAARLGVRTTLAGGLGLCALGLVLMHGVGADSSWTRLLPGLLVFGAGGGLVNPTMTVAALSVVPATRSGMASGVNNTCRQLGIAAGIAGLGAVLQAREGRELVHGADRAAAFATALNEVLVASTAIALVGVLIVVALVRPGTH
jgi:EmrB/QacA subfamily drug resistance transporter